MPLPILCSSRLCFSRATSPADRALVNLPIYLNEMRSIEARIAPAGQLSGQVFASRLASTLSAGMLRLTLVFIAILKR